MPPAKGPYGAISYLDLICLGNIHKSGSKRVAVDKLQFAVIAGLLPGHERP